MSEHHVTRRDFLRASSTLAAATAMPVPAWLEGAPPLRFGMVTDIHYADIDAAGARTYRESTTKLAECARFMNEQKVGFLIELGDFKDQGKPPDEAGTLGYLRKIEEVFRGFKGLRFHVLGNHDVDSISKQQFLDVVGMPARASSGTGTCYEFAFSGAHFIVLDANFRADGIGYDHGNYAWEDSNVPASEMKWLQEALTRAPGPVIAFIHQRLDGEGGYFVKNAAAVRAVLEASKKVAAVFQGHQHEGGYSRINGIHYYTLKSVIEGSGPDNSAYAIVEADAALNLTVTGYRKAESRKLERGC